MRYVIRKNGLTRSEYIKRNGEWTDQVKDAAKFSSQNAADRFAVKNKLGSKYGLFPA